MSFLTTDSWLDRRPLDSPESEEEMENNGSYSNGYEAEFFLEDPDGELECGICFSVMKDPVQCQRGHAACRTCLLKSQRMNQKCPFDNLKLNIKDIVPCLLAAKMIARLKVRCLHKGSGTQTQG
jgi:hypothetical protein